MQGFAEALVSKEKSSLIPEEYDYWKELIGSWRLDYIEGRGTDQERHINGEWHFARVLEGLGIGDVFICPIRGERSDPEEGEYGLTVRMFNLKTCMWDMVYTCLGSISRFTGVKENGSVILTNNSNRRNRWVFTEIRPDSFHWQNETTLQDGTIKVWCEVYAERVGGEADDMQRVAKEDTGFPG